ncbi:excinuclease ABC subunit UvrA, partial [Bacillus subtilis]
DDTMRAADYLVDVGPGAGEHGGEIVASGTPKQVMSNKHSLTGQYLSGKKRIEVPEARRDITDRKIIVKGARSNNLKGIDVDFPLSTMTVVTGVSGSGKSTLVNEVLYKSLAKQINKSKVKPGEYDEINGIDQLDRIIDIDQSPIGRTPRSNPATYT